MVYDINTDTERIMSQLPRTRVGGLGRDRWKGVVALMLDPKAPDSKLHSFLICTLKSNNNIFHLHSRF